MIDTHCHLTFPEFAGQVPRVLADAAAAGVTGVITISTTTDDCLDALEIARAHPNVWCTAGVHPLYADVASERAQRRAAMSSAGHAGGAAGAEPDAAGQGGHNWANLARVASDPKCVAWGELGLDKHYPTPPLEVQRAVLDQQLAFIMGFHARARLDPGSGARELPIVIHCREAFDELIPVLKTTGLSPERFVFHCFTGDSRDMRAILDFGACVSFTGVITYSNAKATQEAARLVPDDRFMVETDAPFLSPIPHRGKKPCVPAYTADTARALAVIRGVGFETLHEQVNATTRRFFGIG